MPVQINELPAVASALNDHEIPAQRGGQTVKLTAQQLATFIIAIVTDSAPTTLDTLNELAAALGDDPNFATTVTNALANKQPLDAMLTALAALSSANGKFLAFSGADAPVVRDIVGTVSQSSGVPTGAVVESGSNANGRYTKWADGTMMCWHDVNNLNSNSAAGSIFRSSVTATWTFPAAFIAVPVCSAQIDDITAMWVNIGAQTTTQASIRAFSTSSVASNFSTKAMAIGRWF